MFIAYSYSSHQNTAIIKGISELPALPLPRDTVLWVDVEEPEESELEQLGAALSLDAEAIEDCRQGEQRPRIDEFEDYIFLVLYGMIGVEDDAEIEPRKLAAFCGQNFLVTVHREPLVTIREVRQRLEKQPTPMMKRGVSYLLCTIIDGMVDKYGQAIVDYETAVEQLEDESLATHVPDSILQRTAELRQKLLAIRRPAQAQRELLNPLANGEYTEISDSIERQFHHVRDHLLVVVEQIDGLRERLQVVRDNYHAALSKRTNDIMRILTLFSAVLLPLTFLASIFGMNLEFWPPKDDPASFWAVLLLMLLLGTGSLVFFRWRRWL